MMEESVSSNSGSPVCRVMSVPSVFLREKLSILHISNLIICNMDILNQREKLVKGKQDGEISLLPAAKIVAHHVGRGLACCIAWHCRTSRGSNCVPAQRSISWRASGTDRAT